MKESQRETLFANTGEIKHWDEIRHRILEKILNLLGFDVVHSNHLAKETNKRIFEFSLLKDWQSIDEKVKDQFSRCEQMGCECKWGENRPFCHSCNILYNHFEIIALAIKEKFADEGILKHAFQDLFNRWYSTCNSYLEAHGDTKETIISKLHNEWSEAKKA